MGGRTNEPVPLQTVPHRIRRPNRRQWRLTLERNNHNLLTTLPRPFLEVVETVNEHGGIDDDDIGVLLRPPTLFAASVPPVELPVRLRARLPRPAFYTALTTLLDDLGACEAPLSVPGSGSPVVGAAALAPVAGGVYGFLELLDLVVEERCTECARHGDLVGSDRYVGHGGGWWWNGRESGLPAKEELSHSCAPPLLGNCHSESRIRHRHRRM